MDTLARALSLSPRLTDSHCAVAHQSSLAVKHKGAIFISQQARMSLRGSIRKLSSSIISSAGTRGAIFISQQARMPLRGSIRKLSSSNKSFIGRRAGIDMFLLVDCKLGKIDVSDAHYYFDYMLSMKPSPPISDFSILLGGLVKAKHFSLVVSFFKTLSTSGALGYRSNGFILNILINCYGRMKLGNAAFSAFALVLKNGYRPGFVTFNSLLKGLCFEEKVDEALVLFSKMIRLGYLPNLVTYNTVIDGLCKTGNTAAALQMHQNWVNGKVDNSKESRKPSTNSYVLIDGRCIELPMTDGKGRCLRLPGNVVSYNCLIDGLCRSGMEEDAKSLFVEMIHLGFHPDVVTFNILVNLLCKKGKVEQVMKLFDMMVQRGVNPDLCTYTSLIKALCLDGRIDDSWIVFSLMGSHGHKRDDVACNTLIHGYCKAGMLKEAHTMLLEMDVNGCSPDVISYNTLIDGYSKAGMLKEAYNLLLEMEEKGCSPDVVSYNTLIDGYCKAGMLKEAYNLLLEMEEKGCSPDIITFNTLIHGFARQKESARVKELIEKMHERKISPDLNAMCNVLERINKDGSGDSWIDSLPDFSSMKPVNDTTHRISMKVNLKHNSTTRRKRVLSAPGKPTELSNTVNPIQCHLPPLPNDPNSGKLRSCLNGSAGNSRDGRNPFDWWFSQLEARLR